MVLLRTSHGTCTLKSHIWARRSRSSEDLHCSHGHSAKCSPTSKNAKENQILGFLILPCTLANYDASVIFMGSKPVKYSKGRCRESLAQDLTVTGCAPWGGRAAFCKGTQRWRILASPSPALRREISDRSVYWVDTSCP